MNDLREPRRYKIPSELNDDERAAASRFGADGKFERDEYRRWRRRVLRDERDDLELRSRLLEQEAEAIRGGAADRTMDAREALSAEDWFARDAAKREGQQVEPLDDGGAARLEAEAAELEREAQEIAQHLAETTEAA